MENAIGLRIKELREIKNLSQAQLAKEMGKSDKQIVSNWETGKNSPATKDLSSLAEILGTTIDYLIRGVEPKPMLKEGEIILTAQEAADYFRNTIKEKDKRIEELEEKNEHSVNDPPVSDSP